jgi:hypothetical protein
MTSKYQAKQQASKKTSLAGTAPVAAKAVPGPINRKMALRLAYRVFAWKNPQDKRFSNQIDKGGAKCPGSFK